MLNYQRYLEIIFVLPKRLTLYIIWLTLCYLCVWKRVSPSSDPCLPHSWVASSMGCHSPSTSARFHSVFGATREAGILQNWSASSQTSPAGSRVRNPVVEPQSKCFGCIVADKLLGKKGTENGKETHVIMLTTLICHWRSDGGSPDIVKGRQTANHSPRFPGRNSVYFWEKKKMYATRFYL